MKGGDKLEGCHPGVADYEKDLLAFNQGLLNISAKFIKTHNSESTHQPSSAMRHEPTIDIYSPPPESLLDDNFQSSATIQGTPYVTFRNVENLKIKPKEIILQDKIMVRRPTSQRVSLIRPPNHAKSDLLNSFKNSPSAYKTDFFEIKATNHLQNCENKYDTNQSLEEFKENSLKSIRHPDFNYDEISRDSDQILGQMTHSQILDAREELLKSLSPALIAKFSHRTI